MTEAFQRLFSRAEPPVLSMKVQAALGPVRPPRRSQTSLLIRHFMERFFNHETASPDGDAKTRMVQIACAVGLPPLMVAVYLWPAYHPIKGWPPGQPASGEPPPYWLQVNHHLFFVLYSFVALGIATVFEWDLFFPDLLDLFVLGTLPIAPRRAFIARVCSIALLIGGFLVAVNSLAVLVLPMAMDPPSLGRFVGGHVLAVVGSGTFAAASIIGFESLLVCLLGDRLFRRWALALQALAITFLVMLMLLFPVLSGVVPVVLQSGSGFARWLPPFWFLGMEQRVIEGPSASPIYTTLAQTGVLATVVACTTALVAYPLAYVRRSRGLVEGTAARTTSKPLRVHFNALLHRCVVRLPMRRAVFHFISQTLLRVPRYRIYLVIYGGVGLSVVAASILRFTTFHHRVQLEISADGIRVATAVVVFWMVAGLRMAFVSSGNQRGRWLFRFVHGSPQHLSAAVDQSVATRRWVLMAAGIVSLCAVIVFRLIAPPELRSWDACLAQALIAAVMCLVLTDAFFLNVTTIPFTGEPTREEPNLALTVLKYFTFFPLVSALPLRLEPWIETSLWHFLVVIGCAIGVHLLLNRRHYAILRDYSSQLALEADEEDFPMNLGLRY